MTTTIQEVRARQIYDSRGNPTLEVEVQLASGVRGRASVPAGASTGRHEAKELRDGGKAFGGLGVTKAVENVRTAIAAGLAGRDALLQADIDRALLAMDGTETKERLGANAILGASLATARAAAQALDVPLFRYLGGLTATTLPVPFLNVVNGGRHADNALAVQEFMIVPAGFACFADALAGAVEVYHALKAELKARSLRTAVGDEGGFAPDLEDDEEALEVIQAAILRAGFTPGDEVSLAIDLAANELKTEGGYTLGGKTLSPDAYLDRLEGWVDAFPIVSLEDPMAEDDRPGWREVSRRLGGKVQIVGDDIFVTDPARLQAGAEEGIANAILVKTTQIGSLTETMETVALAKRLGYRTVISHRSGETEDAFIADLTVGLSVGQIKAGAPARQERLAKYNQLLRIEEALSAPAFAGRLVFARP